MFRDWPFLSFSSRVPLATAANFRLFLFVAIFWRDEFYWVAKTDFKLIQYFDIIMKKYDSLEEPTTRNQ